jgi:ethanolamine ammonia-lyase small subunit
MNDEQSVVAAGALPAPAFMPASAAPTPAPAAPEPVCAATAVTPDGWTALRRHTPARIALGRAGASLPTAEVLRLGLAHAQARDAVQLPLDAGAIEAALRDAGFGTLRAESAAPDRATYLLRPDLGRRLSERAEAALRSAQREAGGPPCDLLLVIGDGLSSLGVARHAVPLAQAIRCAMPAGWTLGPAVVATQARVALGDGIGAALGARMVAVLIGERPGLSSPDSLGVYLTWAPHPGRTDAERYCVSNIRPDGLDVERAARKVAWLCAEARRIGATGVRLKDG